MYKYNTSRARRAAARAMLVLELEQAVLDACIVDQGGRHAQAFRPARGPFRTGPYGPGPVEKHDGPGPEIQTAKFSVRSGL